MNLDPEPGSRSRSTMHPSHWIENCWELVHDYNPSKIVVASKPLLLSLDINTSCFVNNWEEMRYELQWRVFTSDPMDQDDEDAPHEARISSRQKLVVF